MKKALLLFLSVSFIVPVLQAAVISGIEIVKLEGGYSIRFRSSDKLDCNAVPQEKDLQVIVDCVDTRYKYSDRKFDLRQNEMIQGVHFLDHSKQGKKYIRIIVELKKKAQYSLEPVSEGALLKLTASEQIIAKGEAKKSAPVPETPSSPVIGSEDLVEITVFEMPQFNVTARVSGEGTVDIPLIGSVEIRGLTKADAEKKINQAMNARYIKGANVNLQIKEYKSRQVSILGAVAKPGPFYILSRRSLLQVLSEAGGLTVEAGKRCFIFREGTNKIEIDLQDLLNNGNQELNIAILPGDVISIPVKVRDFVYVLGEVKTPGAIEMITSQPMTLVAAISMAGGLTSRSNTSSIEIKRRNEEGLDKVTKANLKDILAGKIDDIRLEPGDVVNVRQSFF